MLAIRLDASAIRRRMVAASFHEAFCYSSVKAPQATVGQPCDWAAKGQPGDNRKMNIKLNGETRVTDAACSVLDLLTTQGLADRRVAVEVNGDIIPRSRHSQHVLNEGDVVEIVHALGGG